MMSQVQFDTGTPIGGGQGEAAAPPPQETSCPPQGFSAHTHIRQQQARDHGREGGAQWTIAPLALMVKKVHGKNT